MRMPSQKYSAGVEVASVVYGKNILVKTPPGEEEDVEQLVRPLPLSEGAVWW